MTPVISAEHLHKRYGDTIAVKDVSLEVHKGEILGILGPNGAGKTTTVECMQGLREPTSGTMRILGADRSGNETRCGGELDRSCRSRHSRIASRFGKHSTSLPR